MRVIVEIVRVVEVVELRGFEGAVVAFHSAHVVESEVGLVGRGRNIVRIGGVKGAGGGKKEKPE